MNRIGLSPEDKSAHVRKLHINDNRPRGGRKNGETGACFTASELDSMSLQKTVF